MPFHFCWEEAAVAAYGAIALRFVWWQIQRIWR